MSRQVWACLLAVLAVVLNAGLGYFNVKRMMATERLLQHARDVQAELRGLLTDVVDAETGYRGFLLSGDEAYLMPFQHAQGVAPPRLENLKQLASQEEEQQERIRTAERLVQEEFAIIKAATASRKTQGLRTAADEMKSGRSKPVMDELRVVIGAALAREEERVVEHQSEAAARYNTAIFTNLAGAGIAIGIVLIAAVAVQNELRRRIRANEKVRLAKEEIESAFGKLRESESRFRTLAESMPQIVWMARPNGAHEYFNSRWYEYTGLKLHDTADGWLHALHEEDRERTRARWAHSTQHGEPYEIEFRLRRHDGAYRWFLGRASPVRDEHGQIIRWLGTETDIDDNKRLADTLDRTVQQRTAALSEQRAFLDAILNSIREGIIACDAQGRLLFNRAGKELYGLDADQKPSESWARHHGLYEAETLAPMLPERAPLTRAWNGEVLQDLEMFIRTDNDIDRYVLCSGQPLVNSDGLIFGAVVSMRDMTERRAYELQLLQTAKLLKTSNEELEKFAYVASHDLQEPLRKIQAFGDRLVRKQREKLDADGQESVDRMLDAAGRMRRLIEDLLAFSRVSTRALPSEPVDLNRVVKDVVSIFEDRLMRSGGRIDFQNLPTVSGDESQLRQLFQNLLGNALKFAKPETPPLVRITSVPFSSLPAEADPPRPEGDGWRIAVCDNGIGFEQQYGERIFELFQRLHGRNAYEGTGLGLAICKKIAQRHGADITARGELGRGATFLIDWPLTERSA